MKSAPTRSISNSVAVSIVLVFIIAGIGLAAAFELNQNNSTSSTTASTTSINSMDGVVTGYVTVGATSIDFTGYSVEFRLVCQAAPCTALNYSAPISPSGHYSALLPGGTYQILGLSPSCNWGGCSSTFPETIVVQGGMQLVKNIQIG